MKPKTAKRKQFKLKSIVLAVQAAVLLQACSVQPIYLSNEERRVIFDADKARIRQQIVPLTGELTMSEAVARGLKYNTDYRVRMMEQSIALGALDLSKLDLLPKVLADAGYSTRNRPNISKATNSVTGEPSLSDPYISSDKTYRTSGLMLNWSVLDFGMSYVNAKQNADRVLIAGERRKKAMHLLVQDIQVAYIRAAGAQKLRVELMETLMLADQALSDSRQVEKENLKQPLEALRYQKSLLDNLKLLEQIESELTAAKSELAQLINLPANSIRLASPDEITLPKGFKDANIDNLEIVALMNNADLQESVYSARIAAEESKKALIKLMPNLSFTYGPQYTNNSYTINQNWLEGSAKLSLNLGNLLTAPMALDQAKAEKDLAAEKRAAMQMSVLTQVHLTKQQLENARRLHVRSSQISGVDNRIARITTDREREGVASKAELVASKATAILSKLREYQSVAQVYAANGQMLATLGVEPVLGSLDDVSLSELTSNIQQIHRDWSEGVFPQISEIEKNKLKTSQLAEKKSGNLSEVNVIESTTPPVTEVTASNNVVDAVNQAEPVLSKKEKARIAKEEKAKKAADLKAKKLAEAQKLKEQQALEKTQVQEKQKSLKEEQSKLLAQEKEKAAVARAEKNLALQLEREQQAKVLEEQKAQDLAIQEINKAQKEIEEAEVQSKNLLQKKEQAKLLAEQKEKARLAKEQKAKLAAEKKAEKLAEAKRIKEQESLAKAEAVAKENLLKEEQAKQAAEQSLRNRLEQEEKNRLATLEKIEQEKLAQEKREKQLAEEQKRQEQKAVEKAEAKAREKALKEQKAQLQAEEKERARLAREERVRIQAEAKAQQLAEARKREEQKAIERAEAKAKEKTLKDERAKLLAEEKERARLAKEEKIRIEAEVKAQQMAEAQKLKQDQAPATVKAESETQEKSVKESQSKQTMVDAKDGFNSESSGITFVSSELEQKMLAQADLNLYVKAWFDALQKKDVKSFVSKYVPGNRTMAKQAYISKNMNPQSMKIMEVNEIAKDTFRIGFELLEPQKSTKKYLYLDKKSGSYQARFHYNDLIEHVNISDKQSLPEEKLSQLDEMVKKWAQARNAGNKEDLIKLYAPDDQSVARKLLRDFKESDSVVEITGVKAFSEERFLLRVKRSWSGKKSGEANVPLAIQWVNGQWWFRTSELRMMNQ